MEDVPVAKRNKLIAWCKAEYAIELEIFDGQALSENLSDPDIFWIAVEFLHIPADIYPKPSNVNERYTEYRRRWIEQELIPVNVSDFCQIKYGIRKSTFRENLKSDLPAWINAIKKILKNDNPYLKRKVQYEICVAALRGQNNLTPYKTTFTEYFKDIEEISTPGELTDVGILLSYCSSAKGLCEFDVDAAYLHKVSMRFVTCIDNFLKKVEGVNNRCLLLGLKARSCFLQYLKSETPCHDIDGAFKYWNDLLQFVEQAPLFPLEQLSEILEIMIPFIGTDPRFINLTTTLDELLAKRFGGFTAAEKCRDRAVAFYNNGQIIHAIDHLHRAKVSWFSAETLRGTILASCFIAACYNQLGLVYASKYYWLSSTFLAIKSNDDFVRDLISRSWFQAAETFYKAGEWLSFFNIMEGALLAHHTYDHEPLNMVEHNDLQRVFFCVVVAKILSARFWKPASEILEKKFGEWPLDNETREELGKLANEPPEGFVYTTASFEELLPQMEKELCGRPFSDIGKTRSIYWKTSGIEWEVHFPNNFDVTCVAEEFVAVLQVILVDLAQEDFQLLPLSLKINFSLSDKGDFSLIENFHNERLEWEIRLPKTTPISSKSIDNHTKQVFAYAVSILGACTTLATEEYLGKIKKAIERGLTGKTLFARPYQEIYKEFMTREMFKEDERKSIELDENKRPSEFFEHEQLSWRNSKGLLFSKDEALQHVQNRYNKLSGLMYLIWPKVLASEAHRIYFQGLHEEGFKDWHISLIACNAITNHLTKKEIRWAVFDDIYRQVYHDTTMSIIDGKMNKEIKRLNITDIDVTHLRDQEQISFVTILKTWNLCLHVPTPDFKAIRRFLVERYHIFDIDIPHKLLF